MFVVRVHAAVVSCANGGFTVVVISLLPLSEYALLLSILETAFALAKVASAQEGVVSFIIHTCSVNCYPFA